VCRTDWVRLRVVMEAEDITAGKNRKYGITPVDLVLARNHNLRQDYD
jgi:hypothetical protein